MGIGFVTNVDYQIKLKQEGKWSFDCDYDGNLKFDHLVWFAGNQPEKFIRQIEDKVNAFQAPQIVELLRELQSEIDERIAGQPAVLST